MLRVGNLIPSLSFYITHSFSFVCRFDVIIDDHLKPWLIEVLIIKSNNGEGIISATKRCQLCIQYDFKWPTSTSYKHFPDNDCVIFITHLANFKCFNRL